ncbi:MAG: Tetratricopeptide repeat protein [Myxococcales bacterium]|nr:Tetratricopeptide repeat protein [Myxococcales bacterium]
MRSTLLGVLIGLAPALAIAQQPQNPYPPPTMAQQPPPAPPAQQQYPYYPPPQQPYPSYPPPQAVQRPVAPPPAPALARLTLATRSMEVAQLVTACANAIDNYHLDVARKKCGAALAKEDSLAFAHYLSAQANAPDVAQKEIARAAELSKTASRGEQLFIEGYRAMLQARTADARRTYDELVKVLPGDARALVARGQFKQTTLEDSDGAVADYARAVELDPKYPAAYNFLAFALADAGRLDEAQAALKKYVDLAPNEANAYDSLASMAMRRGATDEAIAQAKKALTVDTNFVVTHSVLGDALLFSGKGKEARRSYAALIATDDPPVHHDGAMREARSWLFDGRFGDGERALAAEADLSAKTKRPGDQADALVELARVQLDRGALAEAGQSLRQARAALDAPDTTSLMSETERRRLSAEALHVRAMVLGAIGERQLGEQRAEEMGVALKLAGDPHAGAKATSLKGWVAARNGDDKAALGELAQATRPTLRLAYALAMVRAKDEDKARTVIDELARRMVNDMEGALTRPRAAAWLKQHQAASASTN